MIMIIQLLSFNVRGLNDKASIPLLRNYIQSLAHTDVILLQEYKLRNQDFDNLGKRLWSQAKTWSMATSVRYNNDSLGQGASRGGLIKLVSPKLASMVTLTGTVMENRAQWTVFSGFLGRDVGIVNIYAPNESYSRSQLWDSLI